jgi:hypothetical protein
VEAQSSILSGQKRKNNKKLFKQNNYMVKYLAILISLFISTYTNAQLDVKKMKKIQFGAMYDRTNVTGLYVLQVPSTNEMLVDLEDYRTTINAEIKYLVSNDDIVTTANLEGIIYLFARLASLNSQEGYYNQFNTLLDPLSAAETHNIKAVPATNTGDISNSMLDSILPCDQWDLHLPQRSFLLKLPVANMLILL